MVRSPFRRPGRARRPDRGRRSAQADRLSVKAERRSGDKPRASRAREIAAAYARPADRKGWLQVATTLGAYVATCAGMHVAFPAAPWLGLLLSVASGLLVVRIFIIQHDCGHRSFFRSARDNTAIGRLCSLVTLTPFANWARQHGIHHGNWSNLDRHQGADLYSACLTVREYRSLSLYRRLIHRVPRHPLVANVLLPPLVFVLLYRVPFDTPRQWVRERRSVYLTNMALLAQFATLALIVGWQQVLILQLTTIGVASIAGVWLFSLQHRFETSRWMHRDQWDAATASMEASSWLDLPRILHWITGNIGFHHIHHLNPRIPNYRLKGAHDAVQKIWPVRPLSLADGLRAPGLNLWDEEAGRLVGFGAAGRGAT